MTEGIHGDTPIIWQLDRAIEAAKASGTPIVKIKAATPFIDNLLAELVDDSRISKDPRVIRYCGIILESEADAETGWCAYDKGGNMIDPRIWQ